MSNDKQSSIEWLVQQLYEQMEMCGDGGVYDKIIKQAKLLHKQEIVDAYYGELYYESTSNGEHYYNETFGGDNNGEITTNNIPDTNTSTTGNISNTWGGDTSSTTGNINTWTETRTEDYNRVAVEKQIWDRTVNWDIMNKYTKVTDEEQAPYNVTTTVSKPNKTDDGTIAVIEITIDIKQR